MDADSTTRSRRRRLIATWAVAGAAVAVLVVAAALLRRDDAPSAALASPAPTPASPVATTPPPGFPSTACAPEQLANGSVLGLGVPRPARLEHPGPEQDAFGAAFVCLQAIAGTVPTLRTQLPIDVTRRSAPGDDELAELAAFGRMLNVHGADGVVSVRAHDFTNCGSRAVERSALAPGEALRACDYPTPELYSQLFAELSTAMERAAPATSLTYTAWNEPDHPSFTLRGALGQAGAARRAGEYWARAAALAGADRVLAGEFADRDLPTLLRLRTAFVQGAGTDPTAWAIHPYRDLTGPSAAASEVTAGFERAIAPAPVWLTEVTARLSGRDGIGGDAPTQGERGAALREQLATKPTRVMLYLLTPPVPPKYKGDDHWDSALADRRGRARPFVCGLAGLPATDCPGNPVAYGE